MWTAFLSLSLLVHPSPLTVLSCALGGGILRTCVLRPPGIYGPEEQRHLPRVAVCHLSPGLRHRRRLADVCVDWRPPACCHRVSLGAVSLPSLGLSLLGAAPTPIRPSRNSTLRVRHQA